MPRNVEVRDGKNDRSNEINPTRWLQSKTWFGSLLDRYDLREVARLVDVAAAQ